MNLFKVVRTIPTEISMIGEFNINDNAYCYSLELPWNDGANLHGKNCILPGVYPLTIDFSPHHQRLWPHILNVPERDEIRIDVANFPNQILGCIAVGMTKGTNCIGNSQTAWNNIFQVLQTALKSGSQYIEIVNQF